MATGVVVVAKIVLLQVFVAAAAGNFLLLVLLLLLYIIIIMKLSVAGVVGVFNFAAAAGILVAAVRTKLLTVPSF